MCGICGVIWKNDKFENLEKTQIIKKMNDSLFHRGPDDEGYFVQNNIQLAMRRLSIIDISGGHQPVFSSDKNFVIVFNGEIYNYRELRESLKEKNYTFNTKSDTEVILNLFIEYGEECVHRLNGMFSFAIWNIQAKKIFVARDRLGIKPFYYFDNEDYFVFSSEIKSILQFPFLERKINQKALYHYLSFFTVSAPNTLIKNIFSLLPGHKLSINSDKISVSQYWDINFNSKKISDKVFLTNELDKLLNDSVQKRLVSEVPIGAFLSGGIDSSLIVSLMQKNLATSNVRTFTVGFEEKNNSYNETEFARETAKDLKTIHKEILVTPKNVLEELAKIVWFFDQPTASGMQTYFVSKFTKENNITVALSGLGGDELSAGYNYYRKYFFDEKNFERYRLLPKALKQTIEFAVSKLHKTSKLNSFIQSYKKGFGSRFPNHKTLFTSENEKTHYFKKGLGFSNFLTADLIASFLDSFPEESYINKLSYFDFKHYLPNDPLNDSDKMGMANSIEIRVPFIDYRIVEFFTEVHPDLKLKNNNSKILLREVAKSYVPRATLERKKMGFEFPLPNWMQNDFKFLVFRLLGKETIEKRGVFNYEAIEKLLADFYQNPNRQLCYRIWSLVILELWFRLYFDREELVTPDFDLDYLLNQKINSVEF
ncbi:asparagine synthase (glutamine-hydrolyzing) [bacterium]|nr:asparagine synthase (glutamine-hydrolyzing) [bacterium]